MTAVADARLALRAPALLRAFNEVGVLHAADVHVAQRLGRLRGEDDPRVLLAAALVVRGTRQGSVMLTLPEIHKTAAPVEAQDAAAATAALPWPEPAEWLAAVAASPLVTGDPGGRPLRMEGGDLWLDRYWRQEVAVAEHLRRRAADAPEVDPARLRQVLARLWPGSEPDDQRLAAALCALSRVSVVAGGPGTGKTTTVARLVAAFRELAAPGEPPRVALAAPTGKAAARMTEAMEQAALGDATLVPADRELLRALRASTLHRLLRIGYRFSRLAPGQDNPLPVDVLIVDEASMIPLTLFARLLDALPPKARLVVVGDPDQLTAVEAGAVLADLTAGVTAARTPSRLASLRAVVPHDAGGAPEAAESPVARLRDGIGVLRKVHRFSGPIAALASAVRDGDRDRVLEVLRAGEPDVRFLETDDDGPLGGALLDRLRAAVVPHAVTMVEAARRGDAATALGALQDHRLMCAHRKGPRGVASWERLVERWVAEELLARGEEAPVRRDGRYAGLPLIVLANDYDNDLFNGDTGVVVAEGSDLVAAFGSPAQPVRVPLGRLGEVAPMRALTVHRSQGSQFAEVTVLLPPSTSPLATREMLYTAVTRTRQAVTVLGSEAAVVQAVRQRVRRATGLQRRLAEETSPS